MSESSRIAALETKCVELERRLSAFEQHVIKLLADAARAKVWQPAAPDRVSAQESVQRAWAANNSQAPKINIGCAWELHKTTDGGGE